MIAKSVRDFKPNMEVINKTERNNRTYVVSGTCLDEVWCHPPGERGETYRWNWRKLKIIALSDGTKVYEN